MNQKLHEELQNELLELQLKDGVEKEESAKRTKAEKNRDTRRNWNAIEEHKERKKLRKKYGF